MVERQTWEERVDGLQSEISRLHTELQNLTIWKEHILADLEEYRECTSQTLVTRKLIRRTAEAKLKLWSYLPPREKTDPYAFLGRGATKETEE